MEETAAGPLKSSDFLQAIRSYFNKALGTYLYDICLRDHEEKVSNNPGGYKHWLFKMLLHLKNRYHLTGNKILDIGCGAGELTVWMNMLKYNAIGIDVHDEFLNMGKILARENGLSDNVFVSSKSKTFPFENNSFDVLTLFSVLEHISDKDLKNGLIAEMRRICRGVIYILVPNKWKLSDDHTGLWFVPLLSARIANLYIKLRGKKYSYYISKSGQWDVHYRSWKQINELFSGSFSIDFVPDEIIYPSLQAVPLLTLIGKRYKIGRFTIPFGIPLPTKLLSKLLNIPIQSFYPYLNFVLVPKHL